MSDFSFPFFDEICEQHDVPRGNCLVKHLRVPPEQAIAMLQGCIDKGEAILDELDAEHVETEM